MDYQAVINQITNDTYKPIYVCVGTERFLIENFIKTVMNSWLSPEDHGISVSRFDLQETPLAHILEDAATLPFIAERKLIVAENATFLTASRERQKVEHPLPLLAEYMEKPAPFTLIVFVVNADKLDARKTVVKQLNKQKYVVQFPPMSAHALVQWTQTEAKKMGCSLTRNLAETLIMSAGTDLHVLSSEIEKMALYASKDQPITAEMIDNLVVRSVEQNIFLLVEEIVKRNVVQALARYKDLVKLNEEPIKILMLIVRQFRIILQVKEMDARGYSGRQIASQLGLHPYAVKIATSQAKGYTKTQLHMVIDELAETDYKIKTGSEDRYRAIELIILRLAHSVKY